jgi:hypothetical protein
MRDSPIKGAGPPHIWYMFWFGMDASYLARPFISLAHHYKRSVTSGEEQKHLFAVLTSKSVPFDTHSLGSIGVGLIRK